MLQFQPVRAHHSPIVRGPCRILLTHIINWINFQTIARTSLALYTRVKYGLRHVTSDVVGATLGATRRRDGLTWATQSQM